MHGINRIFVAFFLVGFYTGNFVYFIRGTACEVGLACSFFLLDFFAENPTLFTHSVLMDRILGQTFGSKFTRQPETPTSKPFPGKILNT